MPASATTRFHHAPGAVWRGFLAWIVGLSLLVAADQGLQATYFANTVLGGAPVFSRLESGLDVSWDGTTPNTAVPTSGFSVRYTGALVAPSTDTYTFIVRVRGGIRLRIGGETLLSAWENHGPWEEIYARPVALTAGQPVAFEVEHFEAGGSGSLHVEWQSASLSRRVVGGSDLPDASLVAPADRSWTATYFANTTLTGTPALTRAERAVDLRWWNQAPDAALSPTGFSARFQTAWTPPATGSYTFTVRSSDGFRLWVGNRIVISHWNDHGSWDVQQATVAISATSPLPVEVEYYSRSQDATIQMTVTHPDGSVRILSGAAVSASGFTLPISGLTGRYYANTQMAGTPVLTRIDRAIDMVWGWNGPGARLPTSGYSVRWTGAVVAPTTGTYAFLARSADGLRVRVAGQTIISHWGTSGVWDQQVGTIALTAGQAVPLEVEYADFSSFAEIHLSWQLVGSGSDMTLSAGDMPDPALVVNAGQQFAAQYFANDSLTGDPVVTRADPAIDFRWWNDSPIPPTVPADHFSIRWTATLLPPQTGTYTFYARSDDGIRVRVGSTTVIDHWIEAGEWEVVSGSITLTANQTAPLVVEYFKRTGNGMVQLQVQDPSGTIRIMSSGQNEPPPVDPTPGSGLLAQEAFEYAPVAWPEPLIGAAPAKMGGVGWMGPWQDVVPVGGSGACRVGDAGLMMQGLATSGSALTTHGNWDYGAGRVFSPTAAVATANGQPYYVSGLVRYDSIRPSTVSGIVLNHGGWSNLTAGVGGLGLERRYDASAWRVAVIDGTGSVHYSANIGGVDGSVHRFVLLVTPSGSTNEGGTVQAWWDPTASVVPPAPTTTVVMTSGDLRSDRIRIFGGGIPAGDTIEDSLRVDELRVATTWAAAMALPAGPVVPEPPVLSIIATPAMVTGTTTTLVAQIQHGAPPMQLTWTTEGTPVAPVFIQGQQLDALVTFRAVGSYTFKGTVTDALGRSQSATVVVTVIPTAQAITTQLGATP